MAAARLAGGLLGGEAHAPVRLADVALDQRGRREAVALAAAARRVLRVAVQLHRVDAGEADELDRAGRVVVELDLDRVAVGDEGRLRVPEDARRGAGALDAGSLEGALGGRRGGEREREQGREQGSGEQATHASDIGVARALEGHWPLF
jgi:hypothetical protein